MPISTSPNFTVRVKDLGRLAEAEVELRPMTLFVGENNSGKSYLATLLWALHEAPTWMWSECDSPAWGKAIQEWNTVLDKLAEKAKTRSPTRKVFEDGARERPYVIGSDELAIELNEPWPALAQEIFPMAIEYLIRRVLGNESLSPVVEISGSCGFLPIVGVETDSGMFRSIVLDQGPHRWLATSSRDDRVREIYRYETMDANVLASVLGYFSSVPGSYGGLRLGDSPNVYFPASRSGLIWATPVLSESFDAIRVGRQIGRTGKELPGTILQFISFVNKIESFSRTNSWLNEVWSDSMNPNESHTLRRQSYIEKKKLLTYLEHWASIGSITQDGVSGQFQQRTPKVEVPIPMSMASSVVTELLPLFILLMNYSEQLPKLLVYEEPEAHLHPRLQRVVAVILARLSRLGTKVLVTTHSETFAQQINNLIKRGGLDPETRAAMVGDSPCEADDWLNPEDVAGYEFRFRDDGRSYTERLEVRPDGIVMPMFNKELLALTDEAIRLDEALAAKQAGG